MIDKLCLWIVKAVNKLISEKDAIKTDYDAIKTMLFSTEELSAKARELKQEMEVVSGMIQECINENARIALDQTDFQNRYESLVKRFDDTKAKYDAVCAEIDDKRIRQATVEQFLSNLAKHDTVMTEFEPEAWHSLVDYVTLQKEIDYSPGLLAKSKEHSDNQVLFLMPTFLHYRTTSGSV